jgi:hypothetical protein
VHRDLGLEHRLGPVPDGNGGAVLDQAALHQVADERAVDPQRRERRGRPEADLPADLPLARPHALVAHRELLAHPGGDPVVELHHASSNSSPGPGMA